MEELSCRKRNPCYSWIRGYKWNLSLTMLCQLLHKVFTPILSDVTIIKLFTSYCWLRRSECRRLLREQHDSGDISYCSWGIGLQHIHHKRKCLSCLKCARNLHVRYITTVDSTLHYQGTRWTSSLSHLIPYMSEPIPSLSHSTPYLSELIPRLSHLILGLSESVLRLSHFIPSLWDFAMAVISMVSELLQVFEETLQWQWYQWFQSYCKFLRRLCKPVKLRSPKLLQVFEEALHLL